MAKRVVFSIVICLLVVIGLLPILVMMLKSFAQDGHFTLGYYQNLFMGHEWSLFTNSLKLSLLTTFFSVIVGLPLGILFAKTDLPFRRLFTVLFAIPLLLPPYITAISWFDVLRHKVALLSSLSSWLFGLPGCVLVLSSSFLPIVMLLTMASIRAVDLRLEEAGILVAGWSKVLRAITIPLIMPSVVFAAILVFLLSFGEFGAPNFLRFQVFPVESFTQFSAFYNFGAAMAGAAPFVIITFLALLMERFFLRERITQFRSASSTDFLRIPLKSSRKWWLVLVILVCFADVVIPLGTLLMESFSLEAYKEALAKAGDSIFRSLIYSLFGATLLSIFGFLVGYFLQNRAFRLWRSADFLTIFLFALPSTVIGIGLISLWNTPYTNFIYATPAIIMIGYLAQYTALSSRITQSSLAQIPQSMEEAAQVLGAGWFRRMMLIIIPMAKRGLLAGWVVGYVFCLRDTGITMMVYPPGHDTLPVRIFTLMANGAPNFIAALCVIMILITLIPAFIFLILFQSRNNFLGTN